MGDSQVLGPAGGWLAGPFLGTAKVEEGTLGGTPGFKLAREIQTHGIYSGRWTLGKEVGQMERHGGNPGAAWGWPIKEVDGVHAFLAGRTAVFRESWADSALAGRGWVHAEPLGQVFKDRVCPGCCHCHIQGLD